jgi:hypothetical protein
VSATKRTGIDPAADAGPATRPPRLDRLAVAGGLALASGVAAGLARAGIPALRHQLAYMRDQRSNRTRVPFLRSTIPPDGVGAEIGVFQGHFSGVLLRETRARTLHLIDPWYLLTPEWHWGRGDRSTVNAVRRIRHRWRREIADGRVVVHVGDDRQVLATFPDESLDWVYLDSSHAYEHTRDELELLRHKVTVAGVIAGDDWRPDPGHPHHGVYRAVNEFAEQHGYTVIHADPVTRQWAVTRAGARP